MKKKLGNNIILKESFMFDMKEMLLYFTEDNDTYARKIRSRILNGIALLGEHPQLGKHIDEISFPAKRFLILDEFIVLYSFVDGGVYVERLLNERQDYRRYI